MRFTRLLLNEVVEQVARMTSPEVTKAASSVVQLTAATSPSADGDKATARTPGNKRIFVGRLEWITGTRELRSYFSKYGAIRSVRMNYNRMTGLSKGFAHIVFANHNAAEQALAEESHTIDGKRVTVNVADSMFSNTRVNNRSTQ